MQERREKGVWGGAQVRERSEKRGKEETKSKVLDVSRFNNGWQGSNNDVCVHLIDVNLEDLQSKSGLE